MKKAILLISIFLFACESNSSNIETVHLSEDQFTYPETPRSEKSDDLTQYISEDESSRSLHVHYYNIISEDEHSYTSMPFVSINLQYMQEFPDSTVGVRFEHAKVADLNLEKRNGTVIGKSFGGLQVQLSYYWPMIGLDLQTGLSYYRDFPTALKAGETPSFTSTVYGKSIAKTLAPLPEKKNQVISPSADEKISLTDELTINFNSTLAAGTEIGLHILIQTDELILIDIPSHLRKYLIMNVELPTNTNSIIIPQSIMTKLNEIRQITVAANAELDIEIFVQGSAEKHDEIDLQLEGENKPLNVFITHSTLHQVKTK